MVQGVRGLLVLWLCATACCAAGGCAAPKYKVTGTIKREGKPLEWKSDNPALTVIFVPLDRDKDKNVYSADGDVKTSSFTIAAIPRGEYRLYIAQFDPAPGVDVLNFTYGMDTSPVIREVSATQTHFDIDLPRELPRKAPKKKKDED